MAKKGSTNQNNKVVVAPPISWAMHKIENYSLRKWSQSWEERTDCRQTKMWFSKNSKKVSNFFVGLSRQELGLVTQFLTGHNRLNRHESLVNSEVDPMCRFCQEDLESSWHLVADCPCLLGKRLEIFQVAFLDENPEWHPEQIVNFIRRIKFANLNQRRENGPNSSQ